VVSLRVHKFSILVLFLCACLLACIFFQAKGVEGGQDSWNHYLISRCAIHHPELLLDQWNKPVFTWCTVWICQLGINALILFNMACVLLSGWLIAQGMRRKEYKNTWALIPMIVFTPILLQNTISGLTEPLNVLFLSLVMYCWCIDKRRLSVALAGFLPFVRTEGFVICGAIFIMILMRREYRLLYWLFLGSLVMDLAGFIITHQPLWIITENPYWKHETEGTFEAGSGRFTHYLYQAKTLFGWPMRSLFVLGNLVWIYQKIRRQKIDELLTMSLLIFYFYFFAHTIIYYFGILGSHGLTRVMAVIAPALAVISFISIDFLARKLHHQYRIAVFIVVTIWIIWAGYKETGYPKPYRISETTIREDKSHINFIKAGEWLIANHLMGRPIIHQYPYFDVRFNKDPYDLNSSYRVWSIDQKNDWAAKGVIVIWDGFSAVREGNMKLDWLKDNPNYKELYFIEGFEKPADNPTMYDIHIFEKVK
jgi:hypothetical protein